MNDKAVILLDKLIQLTNDNKITWKQYESSSTSFNPECKPIFSTTLLSAAFDSSLIPSRSYVSHYKNGYIGLFTYTYIGIIFTVKLMLQASDNTIPQTIASSNDEDPNIASKVKRLFNLIDLNSSETDVSSYIDDILSD